MKNFLYVVVRVFKWAMRMYPVLVPLFVAAEQFKHDDGTPYKGWEKFEFVLTNLLITSVAKDLGLIVDKRRMSIARSAVQAAFVIWRYFGGKR